MKYTNVHTHNKNPQNDETAIINIFAQNAVNFNFDSNKLYSIGLHPWHSNLEIDFKKIEKIIYDNKNIIAIGEIGLDKSINISMQLQTDIFIKQIKIAEKFNLPVIIHCVRAIHEIVKIKQQINNKNTWVYHGFNKNTQIAEYLIENNFILSFGKAIISNNNKIINVLQNTDINKILLENDNAEIPISEVYKKVSDITNIKINKLTSIVNANFNKTFYK